jgi:UrcA family protein
MPARTYRPRVVTPLTDFLETDMNLTLRRLSIAALATASLLAASAASAASSFEAAAWDEARSTTVRYGDLDLATPQGARRLEQRIAQAIDRVCALPGADQLAQRQRVAACRAEARGRANEHVAQLLRRAGPVARRQ